MNRFDAERYVDKVLTDAEYDRKRGGAETNEQMLKSKLIEALTDPDAAARTMARR